MPVQARLLHKRLAVTSFCRDNVGMDIVLNGEPRQLAGALTLWQLLELEGLTERRVAVEVNGEIVPRGRHRDMELGPGDRVEIVHALGGG